MRVVLDIQASIAQRAGVGRYVSSLVHALAKHKSTADELTLFCFDFMRRGTPFDGEIKSVKAIRWVPGRWVQALWKRADWPPVEWLAGPADVFHFPNFVSPPVRKGKVIVTIHDLVFKRFPDTVEPKNLSYLNAKMPKTVERADRIIAVSECTANDLVQYLGVDRSKIAVIYEGVDDHFRRPDTAAILAMRDRLRLSNPYLLMVGTVEPRKNISFLVDVFEALGDFDGDLVIAGMMGWRAEPIVQWMRSSTRAAQIRWLQYVPEEHLAALYAGAEVFVFPSLYEGFGFPPLEAMLCGTPVVAARTGSLPEVLGDACVFVDGFEVEPWAEAVRRVLSDSELRARLIEKGRERAARFTWDECGRQTWTLYKEVARA